MRRITRWTLLALLLMASAFATPNQALQAQATAPQAQGPEAFIPSERLPADSAVSFPIDI